MKKTTNLTIQLETQARDILNNNDIDAWEGFILTNLVNTSKYPFSTSEFHRRARSENIKFTELKTDERLYLALKLLRKGWTQAEVAERVFYSSHEVFNRAFKQRFGLPPKKYLISRS